MSFHEDEEWKLFDCICTLRWRDGWQKHSLEAVSSSVWFTVRLFQRSRDKNMFLWLCEARVWGSLWSLGDRGQCVDRLWGGRAALFGSCCQLLSQFSDFLQQFSLTAVQLGPTSVQWDWQEKKERITDTKTHLTKEDRRKAASQFVVVLQHLTD